jgi:hypothetical protein
MKYTVTYKPENSRYDYTGDLFDRWHRFDELDNVREIIRNNENGFTLSTDQWTQIFDGGDGE